MSELLSSWAFWCGLGSTFGATQIIAFIIRKKAKERMDGHREDEADYQSAGAGGNALLSSYPSIGTLRTIWGSSVDTEPTVSLPTENFDGVLRGWRLFKVVHDENGFAHLYGTFHQRWDSPVHTAECKSDSGDILATLSIAIAAKPIQKSVTGDAATHLASGTCRCGVYLMKSLPADELAGTFTGSQVAVAQCVAWGTVVEHEHGWRAEHCRIERVFMSDQNPYLISQLRDRYGVPIESAQLHATALLGRAEIPA